MARSGRQADRAWEVPFSEEGWMLAGVIHGFLERERAVILEARCTRMFMYGKVLLNVLAGDLVTVMKLSFKRMLLKSEMLNPNLIISFKNKHT